MAKSITAVELVGAMVLAISLEVVVAATLVVVFRAITLL